MDYFDKNGFLIITGDILKYTTKTESCICDITDGKISGVYITTLAGDCINGKTVHFLNNFTVSNYVVKELEIIANVNSTELFVDMMRKRPVCIDAIVDIAMAKQNYTQTITPMVGETWVVKLPKGDDTLSTIKIKELTDLTITFDNSLMYLLEDINLIEKVAEIQDKGPDVQGSWGNLVEPRSIYDSFDSDEKFTIVNDGWVIVEGERWRITNLKNYQTNDYIIISIFTNFCTLLLGDITYRFSYNDLKFITQLGR